MNWDAVERQVPDLAEKVRARFEVHGLGLIATLRRDGSPRISGIEPVFGEGELWLGMMPRSLKALDVLRDPRFALHSATEDKDVAQGDAKLSGRALAVEDEPTFERYRRAAASAPDLPPGSFHLFKADVRDVSFLIPARDHLVIESWSASGGYRSTDRY